MIGILMILGSCASGILIAEGDIRVTEFRLMAEKVREGEETERSEKILEREGERAEVLEEYGGGDVRRYDDVVIRVMRLNYMSEGELWRGVIKEKKKEYVFVVWVKETEIKAGGMIRKVTGWKRVYMEKSGRER